MGKTSYAQTKLYLIDNHILGKTDGHDCYIFNNGSWEEDTRCLIMDCLMGYDPTEEGKLEVKEARLKCQRQLLSFRRNG